MPTSILKIYRQVNNYEQREIADVLGVSQNTYSRLERNPDNITGEQAKKLSEFYNVEIKDLLTEATPIITFNNSIKENSNSANGYNNSNTFQIHENELKALKEEIEYLRRQNSDLIKALSQLK